MQILTTLHDARRTQDVPHRWTFDPRLRELLIAFREMVKIVRRPYAITGAVALAAHGFTRSTEDLDVLLLRRHARLWLRAARDVGLDTTSVVDGAYHLAWFRRHRDSSIRIDLIFPTARVFVDGIADAQPRSVGGVPIRVLATDLIAAAKSVSQAENHVADLKAMIALNLVDESSIESVLRTAADHSDGASLLEQMNEPVGWMDGAARAKEKHAQRAEQARALAEGGEEARERIRRDVGFFNAVSHAPIDTSKLRR
jgi:hypothetical protein